MTAVRAENAQGLTMLNQSLRWATSQGGETVEISGIVAYLAGMVQRVSAIAGWLALAFIVYATLSPIDNRPVVAGPHHEHFAAFALVGLAFGLAYPKRVFLVTALILISAFGLEALQLLTPDRHARLFDALVKAAGGVRDLDALLAVRALGVTRCGASRTAEILDECRKRLNLPPIAASTGSPAGSY